MQGISFWDTVREFDQALGGPEPARNDSEFVGFNDFNLCQPLVGDDKLVEVWSSC
jgi:hypothetical protein